MLGRQLKLRLIAEDPDIPRSCTNIVVSIHAIATFESFNSYLRPRILAAQAASGSGGAGGGGAGTLSSLLAAFAAAAGAGGATDEGDESTDGGMLSSSPPPRRTDLGDASALAAALTGASASAPAAPGSSSSAAAASGSKPKPASPKRRRSSRLSGKGVDPPEVDDEEEQQPEASTSKAAEKPDVAECVLVLPALSLLYGADPFHCVPRSEAMDEDPCEDDEEALRRENQDVRGRPSLPSARAFLLTRAPSCSSSPVRSTHHSFRVRTNR